MSHQSQKVNCQNCKNDFTIEPDDFSFYKKMKVPTPSVCPDCRFKIRAIWRNEMSLYNRKCYVTGENIISVFQPNSLYKVVNVDFYKSDNWDPKSFAIDYDFNKTFFEQLAELLKNVYKKSLFPVLSLGPNTNSPYVNFVGSAKNSYMCFNSAFLEDTMYTKGVTNIKNSLDLYYCDAIENCYECVNVSKSYNVIYGKNSSSCMDSVLIDSCVNCSNCFGCVNLRNKSYCWFNEQLSKEEYEEKFKEIIGTYKKFELAKNEFHNFNLKYPKRVNNNINTLDSSGEYLFDSKNCESCFEVGLSENCKFIFSARKSKDSIGSIGGLGAFECLENMTPNLSSRLIGTSTCENCQNVEYSFCLTNCKDCIGCDSLKNSQYCILNKQYEKVEYEKIREHIIKELTELGLYGLMMPPELSPFAYNETVGQDNMPLTREEAIAQGYRWEDDIQKTEGKETLKLEDLPDNIKDVEDSIIKEVLACKDCNRNFKITEQELMLYRKLVLPIPHQCFYCRHKERIERRGPYKFWSRNCAKCDKNIVTNYAPERPEIVYCERCYQNEVY